ncbi:MULTISPECIES: hypothetical protein [Sneathiella]|jgi:hypothetical protein|nr:hypothetical protein [Sneathiella aquimaris]
MAEDDERKKMRNRNLVVGGILFALVILFYLITVVKMTGAGG